MGIGSLCDFEYVFVRRNITIRTVKRMYVCNIQCKIMISYGGLPTLRPIVALTPPVYAVYLQHSG